MAASSSSVETYTYTTPSGSVLFRNVLSPHVYGNIVKVFPRWVHPNIVTALGFLSASTAAVLAMYHSPMLESSAPQEVYGWMTLGMVLYTIFDNTDGKQARRTGSSSFVGEVLDHGVDFTVVTASILLVYDATGFLAAHPYCAMYTYAAVGLAQFMNNWYHSITNKMSWGGEWISVDEALLLNICLIGYRWLQPETPLFKTTVFTVPEEYRGWASSVVETDGTMQLIPFLILISFFTAILDCWTKLLDSIQHATNEGTVHKAYRSLLPIILFYLTFFFFLPAKENFPAYIVLSGAVFAAVGCRLIMTSTCSSTVLAGQQHASMFIGFFIMFFQKEVAALTIQVFGSILDEQQTTFYEQFGAALAAWSIFAAFFITGIREINFSKGGGSMFVIVPKKKE